MKKILTTLILSIIAFTIVGCTDSGNESPSKNPSFAMPSYSTLQPMPSESFSLPSMPPSIPAQHMRFASKEEAITAITSGCDWNEYYYEHGDTYNQMMDRFKRAGYLPYATLDGKEALGATGISLQPEVDMIDIGTSCGGNYNDKRYAIKVYFIKDEFAEQAQSGIREYMSARFSDWNLSIYKDTSILFNGKTTNAIAFTRKEDSNMDFYWVFDDELYIKVRYWSIKEAEALDFIEHMSIEKFPLTA